MKVLCIGRISYDISLPLNEYPVEGGKYKEISKVEGVSGGAGTASLLLGKWGVETYAIGVVGNDIFGNRIKREYETLGIFTKFLEVNYEKDTIINYVINNETNGSRTIISSSTIDVKLTKNSYEIENPEGLFLDGTEYEASSNALIRYKEAHSLIAATDNNKETIDLCNRVKTIVCPIEFAESVTGIKVDPNNPQSYVTIFQAMKDRFKNQTIIITLGIKGVLYNVDYDVRIMPPISVKSKDSTGVGDIFRAALLYGIISNKKPETCIRLANITAGLSTANVGIKNSVYKLEEVETYAKNINESIY